MGPVPFCCTTCNAEDFHKLFVPPFRGGMEINMSNQRIPLPELIPTKHTLPVLDADTVSNTILKKCGPCNKKVYGNGIHNVFVLPEAYAELENMICFGKARSVNKYEQQYQGLGYLFQDPDGRVNAVITHFIYVYSVSRGELFAKVCEKDTSMLDVLKNERDIYRKFEAEFNDYDGTGKYEINPFLEYGNSRLVLNGHTHPRLGCFFSGPDRISSYATDGFPAVTMVCDPIKEDIKVMVGFDEDTKVTVFSYADEKENNDTVSKIKELFETLCNIKGMKGKLRLGCGKGEKFTLSLNFTCKPEKSE